MALTTSAKKVVSLSTRHSFQLVEGHFHYYIRTLYNSNVQVRKTFLLFIIINALKE